MNPGCLAQGSDQHPLISVPAAFAVAFSSTIAMFVTPVVGPAVTVVRSAANGFATRSTPAASQAHMVPASPMGTPLPSGVLIKAVAGGVARGSSL